MPNLLPSLTLLLAAPLSLAQTPTPAAIEAIHHQPISFEANQGQHPADIEFVARTSHFTALLGDAGATRILLPSPHPSRSAAVVALPASPRLLTMHLVGGNPRATSTGQEPLATRSNYFLGGDPAAWRTGIPHFAQVRVRAVYPRIDMLFYATDNQLEYDFLLAPEADPHHLRLGFSGQNRLTLTPAGDLTLHAGPQQFTLKSPVAYQLEHGQRHPIPARFVLSAANEVTIRLAPYNHALPLTIDPRLEYSTYLGGSDDEGIFGIAFDPEGNLYLAGETSSTNFPTRRAPQPRVGGDYDAFISKFDRTGTRLIYSTYLGGSQYDHAVSLAVDPSGSAYLAGETVSLDFPLVHPFQGHYAGGIDAFVARLDPSGSHLIFSTYVGGHDYDAANSLALDSHGNVFIAGYTDSVDFPSTPGSVQPSCDGGAYPYFCGGDGFLAKLTPAGEQIFGTYLGGSAFDTINAVKVDGNGAAWVAGQTGSVNFPTKDPFQPALTGYYNAFIARINPAGTTLLASSFLGGNNSDSAQDLALDASGDVYLTGFTNSTNFPTLRPIQGFLRGENQTLDAFVTKIEAGTFQIAYSTYLGGSLNDLPFRITVDPSGAASITGFTYSDNFPVENPLHARFAGGTTDTFVSRLDPSGSKLSFSTYLGGSGDEFGYALSTDWTGALFLGGSTSSPNFPLEKPFQPRYGGGPYDAYLSKITLAPFESITVLKSAITNLEATKGIAPATAALLLADLDAAQTDLNQAQSSDAHEHLLHFERQSADLTRAGKLSPNQAIQLAVSAYELSKTF